MREESVRELHKKHKEESLFGRYIPPTSTLPLIKNLTAEAMVKEIGTSVNGWPIHTIKIGEGSKKVLMWSQMHGNESTTTKSLFDLMNTMLYSSDNFISNILNRCTLVIIPMLNPDGSEAYTRANYNDIDLNRDAQKLSQPESIALRNVFEEFKPHYCFNLHGQRTIFGAGDKRAPASISFLSPAQDEFLSLTENRKVAMSIIAELHSLLSQLIPDRIGTYDDSFNDNCVGDYFQGRGVPTILFEAGHMENDYEREKIRYLIYYCYLMAISSIANESYLNVDYKNYFNIPENKKSFYDIIIRNASVNYAGKATITDIAFQYEELLKDNAIYFLPKIVKISDLGNYYGHKEVDANGHRVLTADKNEITMNYANDFVLLNNELLSLNYQNI